MSKYIFALLLNLITAGAMAETSAAPEVPAADSTGASQKSSAAASESSCSCCQGS